MLGKLKEVNAWLYIPTNDIAKLEGVNEICCEPMTKGETGIFPYRSVKEMDRTKSSHLRRENKVQWF